ncbi:RagB/SusD family nutrient uptake outer membrane protein [Dysgonomonas capnocytophagoides]|uniref:RagB/SusD family nutrient uptake outer membrane protein n=1 Tax=Dysgonomonas capnocytophagoides TaxID=45254 RepID=A0A4Y8KX73_9BACT|nr:RagB/SusD family nutrient uptake outer membrane protein [Dysgonomonas capnocytophagoides]TFD94217.1 RagB/SusD family nutrient uptake outer membrane protein [Dysgonomonas capnocytophagoides]
MIFNKIKYRKPQIGLWLILALLFSSCSDFLDVDPTGELPSITTVSEANAALNGVYARMKSRRYYGTDLITYGDVRGDDMATSKIGDRTASAYQFANLSSLTYTNVGYFWQYIYDELNRINSLLEKIDSGDIKVTTDAEKSTVNDIKGQLYTLRALAHFNLVRIHGEPYLKNKEALGIVVAERVIDKGEFLKRSTVEDAYTSIVKDLKLAIEDNLISKTKKDGYVNYWGAESLLARVYLHMGNWEGAYNLSVDVIKNGGYSLISNADYVSSWAKSSTTESIFEIVSLETDNADREGIGYVMKPRNSSTKGYGAVSLSDDFIALMNQDPKDVRLGLLQEGDYNAQGYLAKYPGQNDNVYVNNTRVVRLSDVYLMAAEAGVYANKSDASDYLNAIRKRANPEVTDIVATAKLVETERRKELVGEGTRFFDIIRNLGTETVQRKGQKNYPVSSTMLPEISWNNEDTYRLIMPIPSSEMDVNGVIQQNPGYTN